jgi:hypothetical protein
MSLFHLNFVQQTGRALASAEQLVRASTIGIVRCTVGESAVAPHRPLVNEESNQQRILRFHAQLMACTFGDEVEGLDYLEEIRDDCG